jgi:hypothetical protein
LLDAPGLSHGDSGNGDNDDDDDDDSNADAPDRGDMAIQDGADSVDDDPEPISQAEIQRTLYVALNQGAG